ncbi:MAG TPA: FAD-dependent oxidoreductase [Arachidicoccus sp.]|nr:FAD-dependent oxidoreductase [Arachidicoccus sp.]
MDLYSGLPFWIVKNALHDYFRPLEEDLNVEVAIIGSGITGSLVAHELCTAGIECAVFDKRTLSTGSSSASTAQLQYEIDIPLYAMIPMLGEQAAVDAYFASLQSIDRIEEVFGSIGADPDFERVPTVFAAHDKRGLIMLEKEFKARQRAGLPVEFLDKAALWTGYKINGTGALKNDRSAQMDCYKGATEILKYHQKNIRLAIYSPTGIATYNRLRQGYELITDDGNKVKCNYLIIAAGFEAGKFLPKKVMDLNSTYVAISQQVHAELLWPERCLYWNTEEPYYYMRTTKDNRMIIGGEDVSFRDPIKRDLLLRNKTKKLEKRFAKIYPDTPFVVDMAWCGTFSSTKDGLPYIGSWPDDPHMLFALGYGGNGITFSMIAAEVLKNIILGQPDPRVDLFGFERKHLR